MQLLFVFRGPQCPETTPENVQIMYIIFENTKESNQASENMQLKRDQNKKSTLSLNTCNGIPIATKGPLEDTLHFERKKLDFILFDSNSMIVLVRNS